MLLRRRHHACCTHTRLPQTRTGEAQALGFSDVRCGSVTFVQRFGSSLNVNPHIHVLFLDGVYVEGDTGPKFISAAKLGDGDVQQIVETTAHRLIRLCMKRGLLDDSQVDTLADEEPVLAFTLKTPWSNGTTHLLLSPMNCSKSWPPSYRRHGST